MSRGPYAVRATVWHFILCVLGVLCGQFPMWLRDYSRGSFCIAFGRGRVI